MNEGNGMNEGNVDQRNVNQQSQLNLYNNPPISASDLIRQVVLDNSTTAIVKLLNDGVPFNQRDPITGNTALHLAVLYNKLEAFSFFTICTCSLLDCQNNENDTPLLLAMQGTHYLSDYFALTLLLRGADPTIANATGNTTLHYAALRPRLFSMSFLLGCVRPSKIDRINAVNIRGRTPLHLACFKSNWNAAFDLIYHQADMYVLDETWCTAFDLAVATKKMFFGLARELFDYYYEEYSCLGSYVKLGTLVEVLKSDYRQLFDNVTISEVLYTQEDMVALKKDLLKLEPCVLRRLLKLTTNTVKRLFRDKEQPILKQAVKSARKEPFHKVLANLYELLGNNEIAPTIVRNSNQFGSIISAILRSVFQRSESEHLMQLVLHMLSIGFTLSTHDLELMYEVRFDKNNDFFFDVLLHMDLQKVCDCGEGPSADILFDFTEKYFTQCGSLIPGIFYRFDLSISDLISQVRLHSLYEFNYGNELLFSDLLRVLTGLFVHQEIRNFAEEDELEEEDINPSLQRRVPSLVEISRNAYRQHLIERFSIVKYSQYFAIIDRLPINNICKDILRFKRMIYIA